MSHFNTQTLAHFIRRATAVHGDTYSYKKSVYVSTGKTLTITCKKHGDFDQSPDNHYAGNGCPTCGKRISSLKRAATMKAKALASLPSLLEDCAVAHNRFYTYSNIEVIESLSELVVITCPNHGDFKQRLDYHKSGSGCPSCVITRYSSTENRTENFLEKLQKKLTSDELENYRFDKTAYYNNNREVTISCKAHGDFLWKPNWKQLDLLCTDCQLADSRKKKKTYIKNTVTEKFKEISLRSVCWSKRTLKLTCEHHGPLQQSIGYTLKYGCKQCRKESFERDRSIQVIHQAKVVHNDKYDYLKSYLDGEYLCNISCKDHGYFSQTTSNHIHHGHGCTACGMERTFSFTSSKIENLLATRLKSITSTITGTRKVCKGHELDIYLPRYNVAIEVDGVYWHSAIFKPVNYHKDKKDACEKLNINLLQFFDVELENKWDICMSMIRARINKSKHVVHARKLNVVAVSKSQKRDFFNSTHLQGSCGSSYEIGLSDGKTILCMMSFGRPRFASKTYQWELLRFSSKLNTTVVGGAGKLLKYFELAKKPTSLISYANRRISSGNLYKALNFSFVRVSRPSFIYSTKKGLVTRYAAQKKTVKLLLGEDYDETLTGSENMKKLQGLRIWDSGTLVFEKHYK